MQPILPRGSIYRMVKSGRVSKKNNLIQSILCIDVKRKAGQYE